MCMSPDLGRLIIPDPRSRANKCGAAHFSRLEWLVALKLVGAISVHSAARLPAYMTYRMRTQIYKMLYMHSVVIITVRHAPVQLFHIFCLFLPTNQPNSATVMQSTTSSDSFGGESELPELPEPTRPQTIGFTISPKDIEILKAYIDEYRHADTKFRKTILEKVMGYLYRHRPGNSLFDKKDAKIVRMLSIHI